MLRVAFEGESFKFGAGQNAGECALRWDRSGSDGVHANAAVAPLDGEAASEGFDSCFRNGRGDDISGSDGSVGGGNAEDCATVTGLEPAAAACHGGVQRAHEHDADDRFESARGEVFGAGGGVGGGVVDEYVQ